MISHDSQNKKKQKTKKGVEKKNLVIAEEYLGTWCAKNTDAALTEHSQHFSSHHRPLSTLLPF